MAGWGGAAFAVQRALEIAVFEGPTFFVVAVYALALGTTFALHRATRGPLVLSVAFAVGWTLFVEGVVVLVLADPIPLAKLGMLELLLALPLASLIVRRFATDPEDAWFRRYARLVVAISLVVALPLGVAGAVGSYKADPAPYGRAKLVLVDGPFSEDFLARFMGVSDRTLCHFDALRSETSGMDPRVRDELISACDLFARDDRRACQCMTELLVSRSHDAKERRKRFRYLELASAVPFGIALLFAWRGRREREKPS
jgi:hypothetical protein